MLLNDDASVLDNWPQIMTSGFSFSPAFGNIDSDNDLEIVNCGEGGIYAWDANGDLLDNWPKTVYDSPSVSMLGTPVLADVDNDGMCEIIAIGLCNDDFNLFVWNADGSFVNNWPQPLSGDFPRYYSSYFSPAVGDIDNDGFLEIAAVSKDHVYLFESNGQPVTSWPDKQISSANKNNIYLANFDQDPELEIILNTDGAVSYTHLTLPTN